MKSGLNHRGRIILYSVLLFTVMLIIFLMSAEDASESSEMSRGFLTTTIGRLIAALTPESWGLTPEQAIRKAAHVFEYLCLAVSAFLLFHELLASRSGAILAAGAGAWLWSIVYACTDEWHQTFVPGRAGKVTDVLIDVCGAMIGVLLSALITALIKQYRKRRPDQA